jgi:hypothetical protein
MWFRPPGGYDSPLLFIHIHGDDRKLQPFHEPNGVNAPFPVIIAIVYALQCGTIENAHCVLESDPVQLQVAAILAIVPSVSYGVYLHNVHILRTVLHLPTIKLRDRGAKALAFKFPF